MTRRLMRDTGGTAKNPRCWRCPAKGRVSRVITDDLIEVEYAGDRRVAEINDGGPTAALSRDISMPMIFCAMRINAASRPEIIFPGPHP